MSLNYKNKLGNQKQYENSLKIYKKVRLKSYCAITYKFNIILLLIIIVLVKNVYCNRPPRFIIDEQSEIVIRLKEGPETPIGKKMKIYFVIMKIYM